MSKCGGWERASSCKHCHRLFHCVAPGNSWFKTTGIRLKSNETRWLRNCSTNSIANTSPFQAQNGFFFTNNATGKSDQRFCVVHFILSLSVRKNKKHLPRLWEFSKLNWEYKNTVPALFKPVVRTKRGPLLIDQSRYHLNLTKLRREKKKQSFRIPIRNNRGSYFYTSSSF